MKTEFLTKLSGEWMDDDKKFVLSSDLVYRSHMLQATITVPKGFVTDFASVPRVPVAYWLFGDRAHHESAIHDYFYQTHAVPVLEGQGIMTIGRKLADQVFLEAMEARSKSKFVRVGMYWGVRLGGASSYKSGPARYLVLNQNQK